MITSPVAMPTPTANGQARRFVRVGRRRRAVHLDGAANRVERLVGAGEVREHPVAEELVDVAVVVRDEIGLALQVPVQHLHGLFG